MAVALLALVIGIVLSVIPGPAIPFFLIGGALLAGEFRFAARFMDWLELRLRIVFNWARQHWRRLPTFAKILLAGVGAAGSLGAAWLLHRWLTD